MFFKTKCVQKTVHFMVVGLVALGFSATACHAEKLFGDKPLFSDKLFADDDMKSQLDSDIQIAATAGPTQPTIQNQVAGQVENQITNAQVDSEFMRQLRQCGFWMERYCIRNHSDFPGLPNDEGYAAQVQLQELVPNNPYNYGNTTSYYQGIPAWFNQNGSPQTGSPIWGDDWTEHLQAQNNNRIRLSMDYSLTPAIIDEWTRNPPAQVDNQPPGTINLIGNNNGLFVVIGAGRDGHPFRNPMNGLVYVGAGSSSGTVNDQAAPNEGGAN